jgi:hypothetical protein
MYLLVANQQGVPMVPLLMDTPLALAIIAVWGTALVF